jgi:hypothetical protein
MVGVAGAQVVVSAGVRVVVFLSLAAEQVTHLGQSKQVVRLGIVYREGMEVGRARIATRRQPSRGLG